MSDYQLEFLQGVVKLELREYKYKELCDLFGETVAGGNAKIYQMKRWSQYFKWEKPTAQKFLITEIYTIPKESIDGRENNGGNSTSKFLALDDMIMDWITVVGQFTGTSGKVAVEIGLLTKFYEETRKAPFGVVEQGIPSYVVENVLWKIQGVVVRAVVASLERLSKDCFLKVDSYYVLILYNGEERVLNQDDSADIVKMENEVLKELELTREDLLKKSEQANFDERMREIIFENFKCRERYYFKRYNIRLENSGYERKSPESPEILTRKLVRSLGYAMLGVQIPAEEDTGNYYVKDDLIRDTMELINRFFVYMNSAAWEKYWDDESLILDGSEKDGAFWTQYLLTKMSDDIKEMDQAKKLKDAITHESEKAICRKRVVKEIDEESVRFFEELIPNIDWVRVFKAKDEEDEYLEQLEYWLDTYFSVCGSLFYHNIEGFAEKYAMYFVHSLIEGKQRNEVMSVREYQKEFDAGKKYIL